MQQLFRQALVAAFMLVLARRVSPHEFGLVGIANVWNMFLYLFLEMGFAAGLVQRKQITPAHIASAFWINLFAGAAIMAISMVASNPISALLKAPDAQPVIFCVSLSFFLSALAATPIALAQRDLRFKELAVRDGAANIIAAGLGIILAWQGFGVWSVVANSIALNSFGAFFVWRLTRGKILWRQATWSAARELWPFGSRVFTYTGLKYFLKSADSLLVGFLFGPEKLGLYNFAQRVTTAPTKAIQFGLASFLFPGAARLQDAPKERQDLFILSFKVLNYLLLTFSILLATIGMELLLVVFGRQWEPAIQLIRILIFVQLLAPILIPLAEFLKATNHAPWLLNWTLFHTALIAAALAIGSRFGFHTSVILMATASWLTLPLLAWLTRAVTGFPMLEFWRRVRISFAFPLLGAILTALAWSLFGHRLILFATVSTAIALAQLWASYRFDPDLQQLPSLLLNRNKVDASRQN